MFTRSTARLRRISGQVDPPESRDLLNGCADECPEDLFGRAHVRRTSGYWKRQSGGGQARTRSERRAATPAEALDGPDSFNHQPAAERVRLCLLGDDYPLPLTLEEKPLTTS